MVDASAENFEKIKTAMLGLPDGAIREIGPDDLNQYVVVRVGDEFVVDLLKAACGVETWRPVGKSRSLPSRGNFVANFVGALCRTRPFLTELRQSGSTKIDDKVGNGAFGTSSS